MNGNPATDRPIRAILQTDVVCLSVPVLNTFFFVFYRLKAKKNTHKTHKTHTHFFQTIVFGAAKNTIDCLWSVLTKADSAH